jgi:Domain of unknown function (DUF4421)
LKVIRQTTSQNFFGQGRSSDFPIVSSDRSAIVENRIRKLIITLLIFCFFIPILRAQKAKFQDDHDTSYYSTYRSMLTARAYLSRKYNVLSFNPPAPAPSFQYRATTSLNLGIGATYHAITVNIGFGISKFNPDNEKGNTKYLDLQGHFYARKWNVDLLGEFYKGLYLTPEGLAAPTGDKFYLRPDMGLSLIGFAFYRALNEKKFSYQAGLLQNEWQKKSAGSILIGGEIYYGAIRGDSTLMPTIIDPKASALAINKFHFFSFGPGVGYAYTFVIKEHFFILGSATINLAFRYSTEISTPNDEHASHFGFRPNYILHVGAGYNSNKWDLSVLWVDTELFMKGQSTDYSYTIGVGNYRLIYARRFNLDRKTKKILSPIPEIIGQ